MAVSSATRGRFFRLVQPLVEKYGELYKKYDLGIVMGQCMGIPLPAQRFIDGSQ